jgi:PcfJ-like protein
MLVGDRDLFALNQEGAKAAVALFPNQGLHAGARAFGSVHERAFQYLEQAPVMVYAVGFKASYRVSALYLQHRLYSQCETGVRLREMMRHLGYPLPLRRLAASVFAPTYDVAIAWLKNTPPTVLGRIIPEKPGAQKRWLKALTNLCDRVSFRNSGLSQGVFDWCAEHAATHELIDITDLADFLVASARNIAGATFNLQWGWARANEEMRLWHDQITCEKMLRGTVFTPTSKIDLGAHPDQFDAMGLEFVALRTPQDVAQEGSVMRHCVASYIPNIIRGDCHIISLRRGEERAATIELSRDWTVRQIKRRFNKAPSSLETSAAHFYAELMKAKLKDHTK